METTATNVLTMRGKGYRRDSLDHRDLIYSIPHKILFGMIHPSVDLRPECGPVYDQGQIGDCTAHAAIEAYRFLSRHEGKPDFAPSRLFEYWNTRFLEGGEAQTLIDSGATLRDTVKSIVKYGLCPESEWDYSQDFTAKPSQNCYQDAQQHLLLKYKRVPQNKMHMQAVLVSGLPFIVGISVFSGMMSEETAKTGDVPMPQDGEAPIGGHAIMICGYDKQKMFFVNSWGDSWGDHGTGTLDWSYLLNPSLAGDMWVLQTVE